MAYTSNPAKTAEPFKRIADVPYGPKNAQPGANLLDIYTARSQRGERRPVIVWIHGGGWFQGNKFGLNMIRKAKTFVRAGYTVVSVNYRLSPPFYGFNALAPGRVRFPTHHQDVARAVGWVDRNIARYGGNPNRMLLAGESAGGQIASLLATRSSFLAANGVSTRQIKGVLSLDGVGFDVAGMLAPMVGRPAGGLTRLMFNAFGDPDEEWRKPQWLAASPARFADPGDPPIFHVIPVSGFDRWAAAKRLSRRLGQRFNLIAMRVFTSHPGVATLIGHPYGDFGVTRRVLSFFRSAVSPVRSVPVVRGDRVVRAVKPRRTATLSRSEAKVPLGTIRLSIGARPEARQVTCRINGGRETSCLRGWKLRPGTHLLRVTAYDATGRPSASRRERLRVLR